MNNDLEQFSEERLKELSNINGDINTRFCDADIEALARIALSAKQAKPARFMAEWSSQYGGMECDYSEVRSEMEDVAAERDGSVIDFYTTPHPAHTDQVIPDGWKLVPVTPTDKMLLNAMIAGEIDSILPAISRAESIWEQFLAAAPKPESE